MFQCHICLKPLMVVTQGAFLEAKIFWVYCEVCRIQTSGALNPAVTGSKDGDLLVSTDVLE